MFTIGEVRYPADRVGMASKLGHRSDVHIYDMNGWFKAVHCQRRAIRSKPRAEGFALNTREDTCMRFVEIPYSHGAVDVATQDVPEVFGWCGNRSDGGRLSM